VHFFTIKVLYLPTETQWSWLTICSRTIQPTTTMYFNWLFY